jgi:hypothetical protein
VRGARRARRISGCCRRPAGRTRDAGGNGSPASSGPSTRFTVVTGCRVPPLDGGPPRHRRGSSPRSRAAGPRRDRHGVRSHDDASGRPAQQAHPGRRGRRRGLVVGTADPVGLSRLVRALVDLRERSPRRPEGGQPDATTIGWTERDVTQMLSDFARRRPALPPRGPRHRPVPWSGRTLLETSAEGPPLATRSSGPGRAPGGRGVGCGRRVQPTRGEADHRHQRRWPVVGASAAGGSRAVRGDHATWRPPLPAPSVASAVGWKEKK